jgi:hypothetical protein
MMITSFRFWVRFMCFKQFLTLLFKGGRSVRPGDPEDLAEAVYAFKSNLSYNGVN